MYTMAECRGTGKEDMVECAHTSLSQFNGVLREEAGGSTAHEKSWGGLSKASGGGRARGSQASL